MAYIDAFVCAVPKDKLEAYKALAQRSASIWKEMGAISYVEAAGDDVPYGEVTSFPRAVQAKDGEVVIVSFVTYPDKATRDKIAGSMMSDPRLSEIMGEMSKVSNMKLMIFGGFSPIVTL
jgi:uncharacterized protein YbaA (DUF1428 family)